MSISSADPDTTLPSANSPERHQLRTFSLLLSNLEGGQFNQDASEVLEEIVSLCNEAIQQDRKFKASISITVNFRADRGVVEITSDMKSKLPPPVRRTSLMHVSGGKFLSLTDPRQQTLPLRGLAAETPNFRNL